MQLFQGENTKDFASTCPDRFAGTNITIFLHVEKGEETIGHSLPKVIKLVFYLLIEYGCCILFCLQIWTGTKSLVSCRPEHSMRHWSTFWTVTLSCILFHCALLKRHSDCCVCQRTIPNDNRLGEANETPHVRAPKPRRITHSQNQLLMQYLRMQSSYVTCSTSCKHFGVSRSNEHLPRRTLYRFKENTTKKERCRAKTRKLKEAAENYLRFRH